MSRIFDIAARYVDEVCAIDPLSATGMGIAGYETEMTDFSPAGNAALQTLDLRTDAELASAAVENDADRIARDFVRERFAVRAASWATGEHLRAVRIIGSPLGRVRGVFDQMPRATEADWANIAARLRKTPDAVDGIVQTLDAGLAAGIVAARRQAEAASAQAATWAGETGPPPFFASLVDGASKDVASSALRNDLAAAAAEATASFSHFARYLRDTYAPRTGERDACGRERYDILTRQWLGASIDLDETYRWGWDELHRIEGEMSTTAKRIVASGSIGEALALLESDPSRAIEGVEAFQAWLQQLHDQALDDLDGTHFDIDPRIKRMEVMIPPPGGAMAPYYTGPSEDFTRPGRTWWPAGSRTSFQRWNQVSTVYHEGVPGHHLQIGTQKCQGDRMSRVQKTGAAGFVSGHGEGWALYAERLMAELGYLENPDYYMGMLSAQAMRAVRVIVDIGMHLELPIPARERFHPGETWTHDLALEFATERTGLPREFMASEIMRYLGWPAQAISYKVGERVWLELREEARKRDGAAFDLKRFHGDALALGGMGLDQLRSEMRTAGARTA